jgi:hypothetical protein
MPCLGIIIGLTAVLVAPQQSPAPSRVRVTSNYIVGLGVTFASNPATESGGVRAGQYVTQRYIGKKLTVTIMGSFLQTDALRYLGGTFSSPPCGLTVDELLDELDSSTVTAETKQVEKALAFKSIRSSVGRKLVRPPRDLPVPDTVFTIRPSNKYRQVALYDALTTGRPQLVFVVPPSKISTKYTATGDWTKLSMDVNQFDSHEMKVTCA